MICFFQQLKQFRSIVSLRVTKAQSEMTSSREYPASGENLDINRVGLDGIDASAFTYALPEAALSGCGGHGRTTSVPARLPFAACIVSCVPACPYALAASANA